WGTLRQTRYDDYMNYSPGSLSCNGIVTSGNGGVNWSATNDYSIFPVPSSEIEKNPNLTKTPGWLY
ncbi:MAG: RagB/SusD family nutrient uptake outer membrane protein, partial [Candidatus Amulumruptor sp.]|nr:RagB/SusD family nutrient uptake outer membrane protein [Candidatus Amulumruptor sp.]